ncbi:hypothetical protein C2845_PM15G21500 [Panicum miliaceum]|uniref:Uncharacterized protein n=1 Tax=Panicum miliaceum TaxID=4540 RepID=A0A3L6QBG1_PANMI|nr:hypothetical protein C2845_PM15G21500 [Panicum miliaceum]
MGEGGEEGNTRVSKGSLLLRTVLPLGSMDYLEWKAVQDKAAEMVKEMAYKVPELKNKLHFPRGPNKLHHVVSIGSRLPSSSQGESNDFSEKALQAGRCCHPPEYPLQEGEGFPLLQMLDRDRIHLKLINTLAENSFKQGFPHIILTKPPFLVKPSRGQGHQLEHSPKQDALPSSAAVAFSETTSAMKLMSFQESQQDVARPGTRNV